MGTNQAEQFSYDLNIPETTPAGKHDVIVTIGFDNAVKKYYFVVPDSKLILSAEKTNYNAGEYVGINLTNIGGVDTAYNCSIKFSDSKRFVIYENSTQGNILAGENKIVGFEIPEHAVDGEYYLMVECKDLNTNKITKLSKSYTISGLKAALTSVTDKKSYFIDENVSVFTTITNLDGEIVNGTLNLKVFSGVPAALMNIGFETGDLTGWTAGAITEFVGVVATDTIIDEDTGEIITLEPYEGVYMARLGNTSPKTPQPIEPNELIQTFSVMESNLRFAYNIFTYDYEGWNFFGYEITDEAGNLITSYSQDVWGSGTALKTSGWREVDIDVSDYMGEVLTLKISGGGTGDELYRTWVYVDGAGFGTHKIVWEKNIPIDVSYFDTKAVVTTINIPSEMPNVTGKLNLLATLYANSSQIINQSDMYSFFITDKNTSLTLETDIK